MEPDSWRKIINVAVGLLSHENVVRPSPACAEDKFIGRFCRRVLYHEINSGQALFRKAFFFPVLMNNNYHKNNRSNNHQRENNSVFIHFSSSPLSTRYPKTENTTKNTIQIEKLSTDTK